MTIERHIGDINEAAANLREFAGETADTIFVGPALVYGDNVSIVLCAGAPGSVHTVVLGQFAPSAPESWMEVCDTVIELLPPGVITMRQARSERAALVQALSGTFDTVEVFDSEKELVIAYDDTFPSAESKELIKEILMGSHPNGSA